MKTSLPTGSIIKYNFFVNPITSCKADIIICNNTLLEGECSAFLASGSDPTDDSRMKHIDFSSPGL